MKKKRIFKKKNSKLFILYDSAFFSKLIAYYIRKGKKEKIEKKFFCFFKKIDFCLFYEAIYVLRPPVKVFFNKKRTGRHSFKYLNRYKPLSFNDGYREAILSFFKIVKTDAYVFSLEQILSLFKLIVLNKNTLKWGVLLKTARFVHFKGGLRHFRWINKK